MNDRGKIRVALFDFDGTLSLIREGWQEVMRSYMVEILAGLRTGETEEDLTRTVSEFITVLTGKQTIYQMIRLAEEIRKRGGEPRDPLDYKRGYHERLWKRIEHRIEALRSGESEPEEWLLPGSYEILENLKQRGVELYLASGTDEDFVRDEVRLLRLDSYFGDRIYGAQDQYQSFSKRLLIQQILSRHSMQGPELVAFGDGYVEVEETKKAGGIAVGVASHESHIRAATVHPKGTRRPPLSLIDSWKRERLIQAGADIIIPDFREQHSLVAYLFGEDSPPAPFQRFDRNRLRLKPLGERRHLLDLSHLLNMDEDLPLQDDPRYSTLAARILEARRRNASVILLMGAHLLRAGVARLLIDLMKRRLITHVGMNGAGPIHDYEMALIGATTESVADYIQEGQFGLWEETGRINEIVRDGLREDLGFGEAVGKAIAERDFPHKDVSLLAAGYNLRVPVTVHVGVGYDIIHEHPNCDGAALGAASYQDFLILAQSVSQLEGGVLLNFGSAVMGPEVYLKALAMARNVARQEGRCIRRFTTAVFDLPSLGDDLDSEPPKSDPRYYYRPFKTILVRTVRDGGESFYFQGDHRHTFPSLYHALQSTKTDP
ncbi:MAG: HAD family hydrolase [Acidobacteriota bacterium]